MKTILLFILLLILCMFSNQREDSDENENISYHSRLSA